MFSPRLKKGLNWTEVVGNGRLPRDGSPRRGNNVVGERGNNRQIERSKSWGDAGRLRADSESGEGVQVSLGNEEEDEEREWYDDDEWRKGWLDGGAQAHSKLRAVACTGIPGRAQGCSAPKTSVQSY